MNDICLPIETRGLAERPGFVDVPVLTAGELTIEFAVAGGALLLLGVILAFWTEGILRLLWTFQEDTPYEEAPDWVSRFARALGAAFIVVTGLALALDWFGYAGL